MSGKYVCSLSPISTPRHWGRGEQDALRGRKGKSGEKGKAQEKRLFQDTEKVTDKHSNGLKPDEE